jgi:hypothetical protein
MLYISCQTFSNRFLHKSVRLKLSNVSTHRKLIVWNWQPLTSTSWRLSGSQMLQWIHAGWKPVSFDSRRGLCMTLVWQESVDAQWSTLFRNSWFPPTGNVDRVGWDLPLYNRPFYRSCARWSDMSHKMADRGTLRKSSTWSASFANLYTCQVSAVHTNTFSLTSLPSRVNDQQRGVNYSEKSVRGFLGLENPGNFSRDSGIFFPNLRDFGIFFSWFFRNIFPYFFRRTFSDIFCDI